MPLRRSPVQRESVVRLVRWPKVVEKLRPFSAPKRRPLPFLEFRFPKRHQVFPQLFVTPEFREALPPLDGYYRLLLLRAV